ncbi:uncharacterized protein LOC122333498 [Puntigrus tetrazona]|uniref:uncharacterized protein LOC122333498 n=1 Tax=Puntigrus tetrazona TaxID=1606681 RepID=UPI001C8A4694|nr:uncharacterized protein LOC122333498 [Puntigrus tetrazona]
MWQLKTKGSSDVNIFLAPRSRRSISASVGEDVTLNCSVESHITPEHIEEVSWKKTGEDEDILVLLVQSNETSPDSAHERYRDRAEFFTAEISKGNFSIRLTSVRTEDKGVYMCQVFAGGLSANVTVVLEILGFSWLHWVLLILCIIACGFALLFCLNTYSRRENDQRSLQVGLLLSPFITMLLASFIWQVIEGSLYETVSCSTLYILGPLRLFWVTPLAPDKKLLRYFMTAHADHAAFMAVMLSVLLVEHWENISKVLIAGAFGLLVLMCLLFITRFLTKLAKEEVLSCSGGLCDRCRRMYGKVQLIVATCSFSWLASLQLALLLYIHYASDKVFIITALPVLHWLAHLYCTKNSTLQFCLLCLHKVIWLLMIAMSVAMLRFYIMLLRNEHDDAGLVCVAGFVQALWVLAFSEVPVHYQKLRLRTFIFLYGSAGLVLVNSAALMTDLITKAVGGVRLVGDLRVIAFPSEWLFTLALMISALAAPRNNESINASPSADFNGTPGKQALSIWTGRVKWKIWKRAEKRRSAKSEAVGAF